MSPYSSGNWLSDTEGFSVRISESEAVSVEEAADSLGFENVTDYLLNLHHSYNRGKNLRRLGVRVDEEESVDGYVAESLLPAFQTDLGVIYQGDSSILMKAHIEPESGDVVMTSPTFGLVRKKDYGNEDADKYLVWFEKLSMSRKLWVRFLCFFQGVHRKIALQRPLLAAPQDYLRCYKSPRSSRWGKAQLPSSASSPP